MSNSYTEYCRNTILDELDYWEDQEVYPCDLGYKLTETMNANGSCTYSRKLALDYIAEWIDEAADYWDYEEENFGEHRINPFSNPEGYMVCMVIEGVCSLLAQCSTIDESWNDCIELTPETIEKIKAEVKEIKSVEF
ncbi:MAG: hypothetical protein J6S14_19960 [Clostridia bacterium]|nr:hypothetical protein [Clostridia bacterium]